MSTEPNHDEARILRMLRRGSEEAFRKVYDKYWGGIYRAASKYLHSQEDVKAVVEEIFIDLWNKRGTFTEMAQIKAYLIASAKNLIYEYLKRSVDSLGQQGDDPGQGSNDPLDRDQLLTMARTSYH